LRIDCQTGDGVGQEPIWHFGRVLYSVTLSAETIERWQARLSGVCKRELGAVGQTGPLGEFSQGMANRLR